jgi:Fe-Mn family superoxide dismutase
MAFELKPLPFDYDALEPHMSADTLRFHHDKHHQKYVDTLNDLTKGDALADKALADVVRDTAKDGGKLFNQAAQVLNHDFFWASLSPKGGGKPQGELLEKIEKDFGGFDKFVEAFKSAGGGHFGSGWVWLVADDDLNLKVVDTHDAGNPITDGLHPLLTCDVWEHAFYLDYRNAKPKFLDAFFEHMANWDFAQKQFESIKAGAGEIEPLKGAA